MTWIKELFGIITISAAVFFTQQWTVLADDSWQLDDSAELSDAGEIELGNRVHEYILHQFSLRNDPELSKTLNEITRRLAAASDRKAIPFTCNIIQSYSVNAFSAPGGHLYVTEGLLKFAKTEDEVAGIIGHEVAHIALKHASRLYKEFMEIMAQRDDRTDSTAPLLLFNCHLEEFEEEADAMGVLYAHKAGFNPNGLPDFLERHLDSMIQDGVFGLLRFSDIVTISSRINRMRDSISSLASKE